MGAGAFVARSEALKGSRLGGYEIVRLVGHGATASVFEAKHLALGKPVAIKVLHEHLADDEQVRNRFLREGRVAARLRHPNIVEVLDVGVEGTVPYLVMELLSGADLRSFIADVRVLTPAHALAFLLPIASALAHAHDAGVIHRDLKPANIFLARDVRDDVVPKLVDFGLSKVASSEATSSLTATELVAGTVLYMAPEQTLGVRHSSPASDQYSLASILYECVAGEPPFMADGVYALIEKIRTELARPPSHINAALPEALDDVILRALHRDPARRFSSIRAFGRALLPFATDVLARDMERDFADRSSGGSPAAAAGSRPSLKRAAIVEAAPAAAPSTPSASATPIAPAAKPVVAEESESLVSSIRIASPLPCPPGESPFHVKGNPYRGFVHLVAKIVPGGLEAFAASLDDPRLAAFISQPFLASARYDVLPILPLFVRLARLLDAPFEELVKATSSAQCRYDARTVYQRVLSGTSPADIADRVTRFGGQYYDFGKMTATNPEPGVTIMVHAGVPAYLYPWYGPMHVEYTREIARLCGATSVETEPTEVVRSGTRGSFTLVDATTKVRWAL